MSTPGRTQGPVPEPGAHRAADSGRVGPEDLQRLVERFYAEVFADPELGPLFAPLAGARWPAHRQRMTDFWCTTLLHTRSFRGNVMRKHQALLPALRPAHFGRWLSLWRRHALRELPPAEAEELVATACGIARNLHLGCFGRLPEPQALGESLPTAA